MFDLGLTLKPSDFVLIAKRPGAMLTGLFGQLILLPAIAGCLVSIFQLPPIFFIGIMLIACCPGGSSSNVFSMLAKGDVALSVSLTAVSSIVTLFSRSTVAGRQSLDAESSYHVVAHRPRHTLPQILR